MLERCTEDFLGVEQQTFVQARIIPKSRQRNEMKSKKKKQSKQKTRDRLGCAGRRLIFPGKKLRAAKFQVRDKKRDKIRTLHT